MSENQVDKKIDVKIDIKGLACPYTFIKAKLAIESMEIGETLEILLDHKAAINNIPNSMRDHGHTVLSVDQLDGLEEWIIIVRKEKD